jgi:hypothetical protein
MRVCRIGKTGQYFVNVKWLSFYALAAALGAAPLGWITGGVLAALANPLYPKTTHRPFYEPGDYTSTAAVAACLAFALTVLLAKARCSIPRSTSISGRQVR